MYPRVYPRVYTTSGATLGDSGSIGYSVPSFGLTELLIPFFIIIPKEYNQSYTLGATSVVYP